MTEPKTHILVADDSPTVRAVVRRQLEDGGYLVSEAGDGNEAIELVRARDFDAILLDLQMPRIDGIGVLARLQSDARLALLPVVILSGRTEVDDVVAALQAGAHDYLTKPFEPAELAARVAAAVRTGAVREELQRRNRELDAFATRASHDLKAPLAVIMGMAELLHSEARLNEEQRGDLLTRIIGASGRAAQMVDELLALVRFDDPNDKTAALANPQAVVAEAVDEVELEDADIDVGGEWAPVTIRPADLSGAIRNLLVNAGHYGRSDDGRLRLSITAARQASNLVIEVADQGAGVPIEERRNVFDPFWRSGRSLATNPSSTGIGLAIVWRAIERSGGHVEVTDANPTGALFRMTIPLAAA